METWLSGLVNIMITIFLYNVLILSFDNCFPKSMAFLLFFLKIFNMPLPCVCTYFTCSTILYNFQIFNFVQLHTVKQQCCLKDID